MAKATYKEAGVDLELLSRVDAAAAKLDAPYLFARG